MIKEGIKIIAEAVKPVLKEGLEKTAKSLGEGKEFKEAFQEGLKDIAKNGLDKLSTILEPKQNELLNETSEKLNNIEDKIFQEPEKIIENPIEVVADIKDSEAYLKQIEEKINEIFTEKLAEINSKFSDQEYSQNLSSELKEYFQELKDLLNQINDIKESLEKLGISFDGGNDDLEDLEEGDSE